MGGGESQDNMGRGESGQYGERRVETIGEGRGGQ